MLIIIIIIIICESGTRTKVREYCSVQATAKNVIGMEILLLVVVVVSHNQYISGDLRVLSALGVQINLTLE